MRTRYLLLFLTCFGFSALGRAQVAVQTGLTLEQYVNEILLGSGVEAFNIQLTGSPIQIGHLTGAAGTLCPVDAGLVLSSAAATNLVCGGFDEVPFGEGVSGDPDLLSIANSVPPLIGQNFNVGSVNDICAIEFDFVATGDSIKFNYTFGSDEYLFWVNSSFNDVFAFFLSGPGITGPYDAPAGYPGGAVNIAQLPGSNPALPITISSVNNVLNSDFYIDNPDNIGICQNGFTVTLEANYEVECGETYHIRLAIADGSDTALESVVILEAGSFVSNSVVEVDLDIDVGGPDADIIYEDCGQAVLTFTRPIVSNLEIEEMIIIEYLGTAINGADYTALPDTIIFASGVESVSFDISAIVDDLAEGIETVQFQILNLAACSGNGLVSYFEFFIADEPEPLVVEGYEIEMCSGAELEIAPIITGGYGNFTYQWSTNETTPEITVSPPNNTVYNVVVSDTCGMPADDGDIQVIILELPPLEVLINGGDLQLNCNDFVFISANAFGGDGVYSWSWTDQNGVSLGSGSSSIFYGTWQGATQIIATVTDGCGFVVSDTINVSLNVPPLDVTIPTVVDALCGEQFTIEPTVSGGQEPYSFTWLQGNTWLGWNQNLTFSSQADIVLTFEVFDQCGQVSNHEVQIDISSPAVEIVLPESVTGPCTDNFALSPELVGGSGGFMYQWTANGVNYSTNANINFQSFEDAVLQLSVVDQCGASDQTTVVVNIVNPPLVIEVGEDIFASCLDNTAIDVEILSGAGGYTYQWMVADTNFSITADIVLQSFATVPVGVQVTDGCGGSTYDELMYIVPDIPLTMTLNADTAICAGTGISLSAFAQGGEEGFFYFWPELGAFGPDQYIVPYQSGVYNVTATDICGATITQSVYVEVLYLFSDFTVTSLDETSYQFFANPSPVCDDCEYLWDFGDGTFSDEPNPMHTFDGLDDYTTSLQVTNSIGCTNTAYTLINGPVILYIPNAFTPNNDGLNDVFRVYGNGIVKFSIQIFNRWGEVVYESDDINAVWDGSHKGGDYYGQNEIYNYVVSVKGFNTDAFERVGHISLMR